MNARNDTNVVREQPGAELNAVFDALAHPYRRSVLRVLDREGPRSVEELAERIVEMEDLPSTDRAEVALIHQHLPRMADAGIIRYDSTEHRCELGEATTARTLLEAARERV